MADPFFSNSYVQIVGIASRLPGLFSIFRNKKSNSVTYEYNETEK